MPIETRVIYSETDENNKYWSTTGLSSRAHIIASLY